MKRQLMIADYEIIIEFIAIMQPLIKKKKKKKIEVPLKAFGRRL